MAEQADDVTVSDVMAGLSSHGYLAGEDLATSVFLAMRMRRPLLLEGDVGVGKTELARSVAAWTGGPLLRLQCYEGIDLAQAVYEWDYPRQLLHLRAAEASNMRNGLEDDLYTEKYLIRRPILRALEGPGSAAPPVLLIDEIDRADDEFEAFLLEFLSDYSITIPEIGTFTAETPPRVFLTSNRSRDLHDALKRRCLYHWVEHPDFERELAIIRLRAPQVLPVLAEQVAAAAKTLRDMRLYKPPGLAEVIDWATAIAALGARELDRRSIELTLGTCLKYQEDQVKVRESGVEQLVRAGAATR
jgi:MoxR-like ATPase